MRIPVETILSLVANIFAAAGSHPSEADTIAARLVDSNLTGHDSHGVIRVPYYIQWVREGKVIPNRRAEVVLENDTLAVLEGGAGFGQTLGEQAMELGIRKATANGVAVVGLRNSGHLGRIGDWAEMAAHAGLISLHFVNTTGGGILVAPHGGRERRLSANPIAAGVPNPEGPPIILDISTSTVAEGKIKVALNKGVPVPEGAILDSEGNPTQDAARFYANPPGVILPMAGHKGYGLAFIAEVLAGALTGGSCSNQKYAHEVRNNMLTILLAPGFFGSAEEFTAEVARFSEWVRSATEQEPGTPILIPGEPEANSRAERTANGVPLDDLTWRQIVETAETLDVAVPSV
jgi:uncharacterized oxidoreductase